MEIKVYLEIGKKFQKYNENWQLAEMKKKKKWFVRLRDELTVKNRICTFMRYGIKWMEI